MLLPNHTSEEALAVAERVRRQIESGPIDGVNVTASLGVSTYPDHATDAGQLIQCADVALYDAKNRGRNLVRIYGESEPPKEKGKKRELDDAALRIQYRAECRSIGVEIYRQDKNPLFIWNPLVPAHHQQ